MTTRRSDARTSSVVFTHIVFTYLPVFLTAASTLDSRIILFWLWFGLAKNGLINLMHECAHGLCFRRVWVNEALGCWILAPLVLTHFEEYRQRHWDHHRNLGTLKDPKVVYRTDVRGLNAVRLVVRCFLGIEAIRRITEHPAESSVVTKPKYSKLSWRPACVHTLFLASLAAVALSFQSSVASAVASTAVAYGFVYAYGLTSITVLAAAVRAIAEHQTRWENESREGSAALRNFRCNFLTRLILGAYGFGDHASHHHQPDVPYYQLPALTCELSATDSGFVARAGYLTTFVRLVNTRK